MKNKKESLQRKPIHLLAQESLANFLPAKIPVGVPPTDSCCDYWEPSTNYMVASRSNVSSAALAVTLAESFAASGGHLIWIGITDDLHRMYEQLIFKIAGIELAPAGSTVSLDTVAQFKLKYAHEQIGKMWIDFCNVEDCGDADVEQKILASVASFKPTLIVVDESIFDETTLDPFEMLVRQTHALHMVKEFRRTNPMSSVLWHLPTLAAVDHGMTKRRPTLNDLASAASSIKADVVLFTQANETSESPHDAEIFAVANSFGTTHIVPMNFAQSIALAMNSARAD